MAHGRTIIELDPGLAERLESFAARAHTSAQELATTAIARALDELETWVEDEAAYAEYERTGEAIPIAAMEEWVRSWGSENELPPPKPCKSSS
jgi:predicted transcriptional regulator